MSKNEQIVVCMLFLFVTSGAQAGTVLHVDDDAVAGGDGATWATAFAHLQDALASASDPANGVGEIRVAQGTYYPDQNEVNPLGTGARAASFQLLDGMALKGGYAGLGAPDPDARDVTANQTVLTGDLNDDDLSVTINREDNTYHVITGSGTDATATLDGFTVAGGNDVRPSPDGRGGGMLNNNGSPTIQHCTFVDNRALIGGAMANLSGSGSTLSDCGFTGNRAEQQGGAIYNQQTSGAAFTNCTFDGNTSSVSGGGMLNFLSSPTVNNCAFVGNLASSGGGMENISNSHATLTDCTFRDNIAETYGGGIASAISNPTLTGCVFTGNSAHAEGGGIRIVSGSPTLINCVFSGNSSDLNGGAINSNAGSSPGMINCTLSGNSAQSGGGLLIAGSSTPAITNCILWNNSDASGAGEAAQVLVVQGTPIVNFSSIQGLTGLLGGVGNTGADPLFIDADGADDLTGTEDDDLHLSPNSPLIDAGDNNGVPADILTDLDGNPRFVDDPNTPDSGTGTAPIVDLGAYELPGGGQPIPTVSQWGFAAMALLLLTAGTAVFIRFRPATAP